MAGQLSADKELIAKFAQNCRDRHQALETAVRLLDGKKDETVATWSGQAKQAFDQLMESYFAQARKLNDALDQTADKLTKAGQSFAAQDEQFAQQVSQQASSLTLP
ncbi:WXG100 family type VII secretion target [Nocardia tenerifensis]|uniref:ESAT-6-like protein n=1 Tax=Nocardia tenerifensis TaxID=228006 RepID=A0A318K3A4_9NOCA|nr:WXG100 family type VII secretion target [Nocardia tenerifensis]PXX66534.1 WXG100 family type VII secretion target [Nocardia tenerifensis]